MENYRNLGFKRQNGDLSHVNNGKFLNPVTAVPWLTQKTKLDAPPKLKSKKSIISAKEQKITLTSVKAKIRKILRQLNFEKLLLKYPEAKKYEVRAALTLAKYDYQKAVLLMEVGDYYKRVVTKISQPLVLHFEVKCKAQKDGNSSTDSETTSDDSQSNNSRIGIVIAKKNNEFEATLLE